MPYQNHSKSRVGRLSQIHIIQTNRYFTVFSSGSVWKFRIPIIPMDYQNDEIVYDVPILRFIWWDIHYYYYIITIHNNLGAIFPLKMAIWGFDQGTYWHPWWRLGSPHDLAPLKEYWWNRHIVYHNRYVCYVFVNTLLSHIYVYIYKYIYIDIQPSIIRIHTISSYYQKHY